MDTEKKVIAFVIYPGLTPMDLVGPLQVLTALSRFVPQYDTVVVAERLEPIAGDNGILFIPNKTFAEVPHPFMLVVPGGGSPTLRAMSNPALRQYIRTAAETAQIVGSVCTGALILASVGLLQGRQATTHWAYYRILESLGARYVRRRWVEDGKFVMSAGVSAGIDAALYLAARLTDEATARQVQRELQYDPQPPFGGIDWQRIGLMPRLMRAYHTLAAPLIAAKPKRLTQQGL